MGSAMLLALCGIFSENVRNNQVAYIKGWLSKLKDDKTFVISAAQQPKKPVIYLYL
jgi:antirestriction protein ArdC